MRQVGCSFSLIIHSQSHSQTHQNNTNALQKRTRCGGLHLEAAADALRQQGARRLHIRHVPADFGDGALCHAVANGQQLDGPAAAILAPRGARRSGTGAEQGRDHKGEGGRPWPPAASGTGLHGFIKLMRRASGLEELATRAEDCGRSGVWLAPWACLGAFWPRIGLLKSQLCV